MHFFHSFAKKYPKNKSCRSSDSQPNIYSKFGYILLEMIYKQPSVKIGLNYFWSVQFWHMKAINYQITKTYLQFSKILHFLSNRVLTITWCEVKNHEWQGISLRMHSRFIYKFTKITNHKISKYRNFCVFRQNVQPKDNE